MVGKYSTISIDGERYVLVPEEEYFQRDFLQDGEKLRTVRKQYGLTIEKFAEISKITNAQISRIENGQKPNAKTTKKIKLAIEELKKREF